jgi:hypothetical protein
MKCRWRYPTRIARLIALTAAGLFAVPHSAGATFVDFTAATRGPANSMVIDGVTVAGDEGALVSTMCGEGLGLVGVGFNSAIERILWWDEGDEFDHGAGQVRDGELSLSVDGTINSFTILPFMKILDGPQPDTLPGFEMSYRPWYPDQATTDYSNAMKPTDPPTPVTFTFRQDRPLPVQIRDIGLYSDFGQYIYFSEYRTKYNNPASTIQFGFSILSIDYTPTQPVPEPGTLTLLVPAALALWQRRRGR